MKKKLLLILLCGICLLGLTGCGSKEETETKTPHEIAIENLEKALKKEGFSLCEEKEYCEEGKAYLLKKENDKNGTEIDVFDFDNLEWRVYSTETSDFQNENRESIYKNIYEVKNDKASGNLTTTTFKPMEDNVNGGITRTVEYEFSNNFETGKLECRLVSYNCDNPAFAMLDEADYRNRSCNIYASQLSNIKYSFKGILSKYKIDFVDLTNKNTE